MYFERITQYIMLSVYYYYFTGLLEYLLKLNCRSIIIDVQDGGGRSFRRYGLVQAVLHDDGGVVRKFGSTRHRLGVDISAKQKKQKNTTCQWAMKNRNFIMLQYTAIL